MNFYVIIFLGYISLCLLISLCVPCARDNWKWSFNQIVDIFNKIKKPKKNIFVDLLEEFEKPKKFNLSKAPTYIKIAFLFIMSSIGFLLIFLIIPFYLYWLNKHYKLDKIRRKNIEISEENQPNNDNHLYYKEMGGHGTVFCNDCGYKEEITSYVHGFGEPVWYAQGDRKSTRLNSSH